MIYKYEILIYWSTEDDTFIAEVPELPGCVAHGSVPSEALAQAHETITL
ncbi:MAG TPA: type II toxin-antitoxin system HicB family antitoxin [Longimicrobium sp.]|nr:type II toxin-antitoxin system HicB family antitoxin [Longimicrobium sp.]